MKRTFPHILRISMIFFLVTLAFLAIPVAGTEWNTITTAGDEDIDLGVGDEQAHWNTKVLVNNVSSYYPGACWGTRVFAAATGPGDVFYLTYYDINRNALVLARGDNGKATAEKVVSSARSCGVSLDINPVTGTSAVSYRARDSTPIFAYKQNDIWTTEVVDPEVSEGYSTSLVFDRTGTPHLAYDDGSSFSNLMYATRNPDGTWTREIADRGIGGHLVFTSSRNSAVTYVDISPDPDILPTRERVDFHAVTCTVTSDSAGKPHIFYLDSMFGRIMPGGCSDTLGAEFTGNPRGGGGPPHQLMSGEAAGMGGLLPLGNGIFDRAYDWMGNSF